MPSDAIPPCHRCGELCGSKGLCRRKFKGISMPRPYAKIQITAGELIDRMTIFELRALYRPSPSSVSSLFKLVECYNRLDIPSDLVGAIETLRRFNTMLWRLEDRLRVHERERDFSSRFVIVARLIGRLNDKRATLKSLIDASLGAEDQNAKTYGHLYRR